MFWQKKSVLSLIDSKGEVSYHCFDSGLTNSDIAQFLRNESVPFDPSNALEQVLKSICYRFLRYIEIFRSSSSECRRSTIFGNTGRSNGGPVGGGGMSFNNDRMGRGPRNRSNFRGELFNTDSDSLW